MLSVLCYKCSAQHNPPQKIQSWYQFVGVTHDSVEVMPSVQTPVYYRIRGAFYWNTADSNIYVWSGTQFLCKTCAGSSLTAVGGGDTIVSNNIEFGGKLTKNTITKYNGFVPNVQLPSPGTGDNGSYVFKVLSPSNGTKNAPWLHLIESITTGNFDTSHNEVSKWGWNINRAIKSNQPEEHYAMEYNYNPFNNGRYLENHLEVGTLNGSQTRLFSATTILNAGDSSINTSQWDFRQSKWNFMDLQGIQCVRWDFSLGKNTLNWYWNQNVDFSQATLGFSTDGAHFAIDGQGQQLNLNGWGSVDASDAGAFFGAGSAFGKSTGPTDPNTAYLGDIHAQGNVADTGIIGTATQNFRKSYIKDGFYQTVKVCDYGVFGVPIDVSAKFEIVSTSKGFLMPRMTAAQKLAISSPATGLMVYDLDLLTPSWWDGLKWVNEKNDNIIFLPVTGGTVNLLIGEYNIVNPAGPILNLTINFPSTPQANDFVEIKLTQTVTTVAYSGGTVVGAPTAGVRGYLKFKYDVGSASWY